MKQKITSNTLVGRPVLIDWPMRWKDCDEKWKASERANAEKTEAYFGQTGEIVQVVNEDERGNTLRVLLESGRIVNLHQGAVSVTGPAKSDRTEELLERIVYLLESRLTCP